MLHNNARFEQEMTIGIVLERYELKFGMNTKNDYVHFSKNSQSESKVAIRSVLWTASFEADCKF